jgi:hypothetical protein
MLGKKTNAIRSMVMSNISKLMLVFMFGTMVLLTAGCGGDGGDDTVANVAGVWSVTLDGDTDLVTLIQNGHDLTLIDPDQEVIDGEIYGRDVTFEYTEIDEGITVTLLVELTIDSEESPSVMTGTLKGIVEGVVIKTYPMTCVKQ